MLATKQNGKGPQVAFPIRLLVLSICNCRKSVCEMGPVLSKLRKTNEKVPIVELDVFNENCLFGFQNTHQRPFRVFDREKAFRVFSRHTLRAPHCRLLSRGIAVSFCELPHRSDQKEHVFTRNRTWIVT